MPRQWWARRTAGSGRAGESLPRIGPGGSSSADWAAAEVGGLGKHTCYAVLAAPPLEADVQRPASSLKPPVGSGRPRGSARCGRSPASFRSLREPLPGAGQTPQRLPKGDLVGLH